MVMNRIGLNGAEGARTASVLTLFAALAIFYVFDQQSTGEVEEEDADAETLGVAPPPRYGS